MTDINQSLPPRPLLDGYLTEDQLAAETGKSRRTLRYERLQRIGPPWIKWGNTVLYSRDSFIAYLKTNENRPRSRRGRAA